MSTVGIPPKGCPWRTVLRDWKHSFTVMFRYFWPRTSGGADILGTRRLPIRQKVFVRLWDCSLHCKTQKAAGEYGDMHQGYQSARLGGM